jgi:dTDP-4-dehydrorhamnose reductase
VRSSSSDLRAAGGRILVTGAAGMLGSAAVQEFAAHGTVIAHTRADSDLADAAATMRWFATQRPGVIVHCAAWTDVDGCESDPSRAWRDNVEATHSVVSAARDTGAALCHLSTDYVFDGEKTAAYAETDPVRPLGVYGQTKWAAEEAVRGYERAWIVRTSWVFGPGGRNFVRTIAGLLRSRSEVRVVNDQRGSPTYTRDLAVALHAIVRSGTFGLYHVTNAGSCTWFEFAQEIRERLGTSCAVLPCTTAEFPRAAPRPRNSVLEPAFYRGQGLPAPRAWQEALVAYLAELDAEATP